MKKADRILLYMAVFYVITPIVIFIFGWTRLYISIPAFICIIIMTIRLTHGFQEANDISITSNTRYWITALGIIAIWCLFSGIGGFSYQTGDFIIRNPMFRDLNRYGWPVIYNMDMEPDIVRQYTGDAKQAMYVYYFTWWLPVSLIARFFYLVGVNISHVEIYANVILYLWTVIGLFLTFYCLVRYLKKYSNWILASFMLFGGFDFVIYLLMHMKLPVNEHIEWWAGGICRYFQYSANTTQLYWVFNQSVPVWLIMALLLNTRDRKQKLGLASMCIAYSPYATIGIVPIAIYSVLKKDDKKMLKRIKNAISFENIVVPAVMALVFVSFYYLKISAGASSDWFLFKRYPEFRAFTIYVIFVLIEFGVYYIVMGKDALKYEFSVVALIELLMFPLFRSGMNNDFTMRASIPALFLLMVLCLKYLFDMEEKGNELKKRAMMICLCIGFLVSFTEIQRNITMTMTLDQSDYINEDVYSFGSMGTDNEYQIQVNINQYMSMDYEYEKSFFYNHIMSK